MFGSNNYTAPVTTGKRVTGYTNHRESQFKLGWEVTDQTNDRQLRSSKNKEITGKITTGRSVTKGAPSRSQNHISPFNKINEPPYIKKQGLLENRLNYQQSNSPVKQHNFNQQIEAYQNYPQRHYQDPQISYNNQQKHAQQYTNQYQSESRQRYLEALRQAEQANQAKNYSYPLQSENSSYLQQNEQYKRSLEYNDQALRNQERHFQKVEHPLERMAIAQKNSSNQYGNSYDLKSEQLQKVMVSYNQKQKLVDQRNNAISSQNSAYSKPASNIDYQRLERRTPIKPKDSIRDVIFNGVGVGESIISQRNLTKRVNSNMVLGSDNYAFVSHRAH